MKITKKNIGTFAGAAEEFLSRMPGCSTGDKLREDILMMGASDEIVCLLTPDELVGNGTACGSTGNACFDEAVAEFLKARGVEHVLVGVAQDDFTESENMVINGGAVPISFGTDSGALSDMISERGGSWRDDSCFDDRWSTYESE